MMNSFFDSLSEEQRKVFAEVGRDITARAYETSAALEQKYFGEMKARMTINEVKLPKFQQATAKSYETYVAKHGDDYLKLIQSSAR